MDAVRRACDEVTGLGLSGLADALRPPGGGSGTQRSGHPEPASTFTITGLVDPIPGTVTVHAGHVTFPVKVRLDTPREVEYHQHGGIMPYVLRHRLHAG
ncbi:hypothetical protein [Plantactinospora mayteni]|uniref:hypothetical protein n=1 Tax=Plantactinospora mayteni TaxID=566021 RepID=UPI0019448001|nr:hypothetical protein [Plantactinospora mayteni]